MFLLCFNLIAITLQIEALATKLAADNEELRRCLAEIDNLKVSEV
jgi:hypothetical protein